MAEAEFLIQLRSDERQEIQNQCSGVIEILLLVSVMILSLGAHV